jgi:hypothetical protein
MCIMYIVSNTSNMILYGRGTSDSWELNLCEPANRITTLKFFSIRAA